MRPCLVASMALVLGACSPDAEHAPAPASSSPPAPASSSPPAPASSSPPARLAFVDATDVSGLDFVHDAGMTEERHLPETMGAGAALLDADESGLAVAYEDMATGARTFASTVIRVSPARRIRSRTLAMMRPRSSGSRQEGVPPPK